jgi:hypothetical protein
VTIADELLVDDRLETTGNTVVGGILAANTIKGNGDPQVTLDDNLDVTGELRCDTIKPSTALPNTMTKDAGILNTTGHIIADGNISVHNLDVGETFAVRTNTIQPQSGSTITVQGDLQVSGSMPSPFWCAGAVNTNGTIIASAGRVGFTCTAVSAGVCDIEMATAHPNGDAYVVSVAGSEYHAMFGNKTSTTFKLATRNANNAPLNALIDFMVLA